MNGRLISIVVAPQGGRFVAQMTYEVGQKSTTLRTVQLTANERVKVLNRAIALMRRNGHAGRPWEADVEGQKLRGTVPAPKATNHVRWL